MQAQNSTAQTDPGFKLPADKATPDDPLPKTTPETATGPVEVVPGHPKAPHRHLDARRRHRRRHVPGAAGRLLLCPQRLRAPPGRAPRGAVDAGSAGWLLFVGLAFLSAAVVLAIVNASKYLTFGVTAPLVASAWWR
jgi:hypothetical protein